MFRKELKVDDLDSHKANVCKKKKNMLSLAAAFLIPLFSISYLVSVFLVYNIISYIKQKPEANQSTFDIATLHLAWYSVHFFSSKQ